MNIPVEAATQLYSPQPVRIYKAFEHLDSMDIGKADHWHQDRSATPEFFSRFIQGWPTQHPKGLSTHSSEDNMSTDDDDQNHGLSSPCDVMERPTHPPPSSRPASRKMSTESMSEGYATAPSDSSDSSAQTQASPTNGPSKRRPSKSTQLNQEVSTLLQKDDVQRALQVLDEAVAYIDDAPNNADDSTKTIAHSYSDMLKILCEPEIAAIVNEQSHVDPSTMDGVYNTIMWRLFTKVVESGYEFSCEAHISLVQLLMDYGHYALALQAMYVLPPAIWDTNCFRLAITLHLMQEPRQIAEVERLLSDYGKTHITLANPLAPFDLPPIRIDMPNMKNVADSDKYALWMYYQAACSETEWGKEKENYEAKSYEHAQQLKQQRHGRETLKDWAMRRFKVETEQDRLQRDKIEADNTMIYISTQNHQFEYAWHVYERMGKEVDAFTPRVVMHLSWQAYKHTPIAHVSLRTHWEDRAWELYSRFMDSEYLYPNQTETPGFLGDLLSIASTTIGVHDGAQFDKVMELYQLFQDRGYERLLSNEQVITPLLCTLIYQCRRSPQSMDSMRRKAFQIWRTKHAIDQKTEGKHPSTAYSILWILLVFCVHSGDKTDFAELLVTLSSHYVDNLPPTSLLAPIQRFHDRYLSCSHGSTPCHFHHYLFRPVDSPDKDPSGYMDDLGFVRGDSRRASSASSIDVTSLPEPIAHMYETLHRRTNIHDMGAASMDAAVSFSLTNHGQWVTKPFYCPLNKAQALIRHCLGRKEIHDRVKSTVA